MVENQLTHVSDITSYIERCIKSSVKQFHLEIWLASPSAVKSLTSDVVTSIVANVAGGDEITSK